MKSKSVKLNAFTLAEGSRRLLLCGDEGTQGSPRSAKWGFTLAEVLITLGVIGVVAAVTMPTLVTNIQERVRKEQVRTVKYKLTKATDKMNSLGKIGAYPTTMDFVNELKNHLSIARICKNNELDKCWPTESINAYQNGSSTLSSFDVKDLKQGVNLKALALGTKATDTVGIVTGDGVPMLLVYSPVCSGFDEAKTYTWSVQDGKPVTNATTNCISAIFDINGSKGPNKIGTDVRTLNSLFGSTDLGTSYDAVGVDICNQMKREYGIQYCSGSYTTANNDRWVGAIYACSRLGLHLPDMATLANIANARYGVTQINTYTLYLNHNHGGDDCISHVINDMDGGSAWRVNASDAVICNSKTTTDENSALNNAANSLVSSIQGTYWSTLELNSTAAYFRYIGSDCSVWTHWPGRLYNEPKALCVGD